jgi:hypothetical protein
MAIDLNALYSEFETEIQNEVDSLTMSLPLSGAQLKKAFTTEEMKELDTMLAAVRAATTENEKAALLGGEANLVLKLVSVLGVAVGI